MACEKTAHHEHPNQILHDMYNVMQRDYLWAEDLRKDVVFSQYDPSQPKRFLASIKSSNDRFSEIFSRDVAEQILDINPKAPQSVIVKDLGLLLRYLEDTLWVAYAEPGSSADLQGIKRGWWVKTVTLQGRKLTATPPEIPNLNSSLRPTKEGSQQPAKVFNLGTLEIAQRGSNELKTIQLQLTAYKLQVLPVSKKLQVGTKQAGYFFFAAFTGREEIERQIDAILDSFKGLDDLIIDLRYNRGGRVDLATYLLNKIYNPGNNQTIMFSYKYNERASNMRTKKVTYFAGRADAMNPKRVFFLVDRPTASASELLINVLQPIPNLEVLVIGKQTTGKNVGSFVYLLPFSKNQHMYTHAFLPIAFQIFNQAGESNYDHGFTPDYFAVDDTRYALGDPKEAMLAAALHYIEHGTFPSLTTELARLQASEQPMISTLSERVPTQLIFEAPYKD